MWRIPRCQQCCQALVSTVREAPIAISGPMIQEEALQIALKLHVTGFTASSRWL